MLSVIIASSKCSKWFRVKRFALLSGDAESDGLSGRGCVVFLGMLPSSSSGALAPASAGTVNCVCVFGSRAGN